MASEATKRFAILRKQLDRLGYKQPITMESQALVERILSDLMRASEGFQNMKRQFEELKHSSSKSSDLVDPMKRQMNKLESENNELHFQIIKLKEEMDGKDIKWKTAHNRVEEQKRDLKFILDQKESRISKLEKENQEYKGKMEDLLSKLYLPSEGVVLKGVPKEFENEILSKEYNQRRKGEV